MAKKLGKGLGELLGEVENSYNNEFGIQNNIAELINIDKISINPYQPRHNFNEVKLQELAESIKEHGLIQPISVIKSKNSYILIAGERRLRATKINNETKIKAVVLDYDLEYIKELSIIENIQREDLNALELAKSYNELINDYGITHEELAKKVKKSRSSITNTIRLLKLPKWIQDNIKEGKLSAGQSKVLIGLEEDEQQEIVSMILKKSLSSNSVEKMAKKFKDSKKKQKNKEKDNISDKNEELDVLKINNLAKTLNNSNIKTSILDNKVIITFSNNEQIEKLTKLIKKL